MDELKIITKNKGLLTKEKKDLVNYNDEKITQNNKLNNYEPIIYNLNLYKDIKAHDEDILSITTYKDLIITGSSDKTIKIWNLNSNKLINSLTAHTGGVYSLVIWNDKLISASSDKTIRIWDINSGKLLTTILAHQNHIYSLYCFDNFLISSSIDKTIKVWNIEAKKIISVINLEYSAWNVCIHENKIFAGLSDGSLRIYNPANGNLIMAAKEHNEAITSIKIYNNQLYTASKDRTIKIWDIDSLNVKNTIKNINQVIWTISPDKNYLFIGGDDKTLRVWDINNQKIIQTINAHNDWVSQIINYKGRIISISGDKTIKIWQKVPLSNCENTDLRIKSLEKSPFETEAEYNNRKTNNYLELARKIIDYDYINIGTVKLSVNEYNFENYSLPVAVNLSCEKIIKLSNIEKQFISLIKINKDEAKYLHESSPIHNVYIKYKLENNNLKYELSIIFLDKKYPLSQELKKTDLLADKKKELKQDRLDIKINKPENFKDESLYSPEHDCNTISLSDTFRKPFEDYNDFESRVKQKLVSYRYINCGKVELLADKYTIDDEKFPLKSIFTCDKLLNIISLIPENTKNVPSDNTSKQLMSLKKYEFFGCVIIDRHTAKQMYETSKSQNLYINFIEKEQKLFFELFVIFNKQRYFIM